jgi:hypothetical protein
LMAICRFTLFTVRTSDDESEFGQLKGFTV